MLLYFLSFSIEKTIRISSESDYTSQFGIIINNIFKSWDFYIYKIIKSISLHFFAQITVWRFSIITTILATIYFLLDYS